MNPNSFYIVRIIDGDRPNRWLYIAYRSDPHNYYFITEGEAGAQKFLNIPSAMDGFMGFIERLNKEPIEHFPTGHKFNIIKKKQFLNWREDGNG